VQNRKAQHDNIPDASPMSVAEQRLRTLNAISNSLEFGSDHRFSDALKIALDYLGMDAGIISRVVDDVYEVQHCATRDDGLEPGTTFELGSTYCSITIAEGDVVAIDRMSTSHHRGHPCFSAFQLEAYIGVAIQVNGRFYGTLNFSRSLARETPWREMDREFVRLMGKWVGQSLTRMLMERQLREKEQQLRMFVRYSPAPVAMFDREVRYVVYSDEWLRSYGLEGQSIAGKSHYEVFPEITDEWKQIHQECLAGAVRRRDEDPFPRADGTMDWVQWEVRPWRDQDGAIGGIIMFTQVITRRKEAELALANSEHRFRSLFKIAPVGIYLTDASGLCEMVNDRWEEIVGLSAADAKGAGWMKAVHVEDRNDVMSGWNDAAQTGAGFAMDFRWSRPDGTVVWTQSRATPLKDEAGSVTGYLGTIMDISEAKSYQAILERQSRIDELTQLANRREFERCLELECTRSARYGSPLALVVLDIDHFKAVNDTHGHAIGDAVLRQTAYVVNASVRTSDVAGRWGGEEFAILLPHTSVGDASLFADRLRVRIQRIAHLDAQDRPFNCTCSLGVAGFTPGKSPAWLFDRADAALYEAKANGRDRVCIAEGDG
jgi:diguanylate cyclase (GGDEF)-like protein/PAS domain S-box-containing protein